MPRRVALSALCLLPAALVAADQGLPQAAPEVRFHLAARPWTPFADSREQLLDRLEGIVRAIATLQRYDAAKPADANNGAIRDPYNHAEVQYATPYFAFAAATLLAQDRAPELLTPAIRAMDRCTLDISDGKATDNHGEFFVAPMMKAYRLFVLLQPRHPSELTAEKLQLWRERLSLPRGRFMNLGVKQNWRTYASKGEWLRQQDGFIADGTAWIEGNWTRASEGSQRDRFRRAEEKQGRTPPLFLYHDDTGSPETFAYNGGAAGNLLDLLEHGYDGASAAEMRELIHRNLSVCLLLMGGSGEAPAGGRTGDHVWNDVVYANDYEMMAEAAWREGDAFRAGQFRRAARLAFRSAWRFQQEPGWMSVTKNLFHPSLKTRYANYSALTNYNGYVEIHTAEAFFNRRSEIPEQPTPAEIGGYALTLPESYANSFLNAGGLQLQLCTRGQTDNYAGVQWSTLGIVRFSRPGWDSRLGPGDGAATSKFENGVSFAPIFLETGAWTRVCQQPARYAATFVPEFVHPLLVRGTCAFAPRPGQTGPVFTMKIALTPDGALIDTVRSAGDGPFGVIWPLLEFDGRTLLARETTARLATTAYPPAGGPVTVLQAETARASGGTHIEHDHTGFHDTGFADFPPEGGALEWTAVDGGAGGKTAVGFRYAQGPGATGGATRAVTLTVNDVSSEIAFPSTGSFDDWHPLYVPVTLAAGKNNRIRLFTTGQDAPNIDELRVHVPSVPETEPDQQCFLALKSTHRLDASTAPMRSAYGDLRPIQVTDSEDGTVETFVYPRAAGDPSAETVLVSFVRDGANFSSVLGRVNGTLYVGRTSAGGHGDAIDLNGDGRPEVTFDEPCDFVLQLSAGKVTAMETDRAVVARIEERSIQLGSYAPIYFRPKVR